jgi:hypothetical protein
MALGIAVAFAALILLVFVPSDSSWAYPRWGDDTDGTGCNKASAGGFTCHGDFRGADPVNEHAAHVNDATGTCDLCHWSPDGTNSPYLYKADSDSTTDPPEFPGCMGCHGTDYGNSLPDQPQLRQAPGLRVQHEARVPGMCVNAACHTSDPSPSNPESTPPDYHSRVDVNVKSPCDGSPVASGGEDLGLGPAGGLDNDGDGLRDAADPDCVAGSPGEVSDPDNPMLDPLKVDDYDDLTGNLSISYGVPCGTANHTINFGPLTQFDLENYNYSGQDCFIGGGSTYTAFNPGGGSFFFLVVANDGTTNEGSYGRDSRDNSMDERPPYTTASTCPLTQDLASRCD